MALTGLLSAANQDRSARPMKADWVREIRDNCLEHEVPFFFKQWGGVFKKRTGRTLDNQVWDQMPNV